MIKILLGTALVLPTSFYFSNVHAAPVIQELYYDQPATDGSSVFTEIYGDAGLDLTGWRLDAINGSNDTVYRSIGLTGAVIPADGLLLISTPLANSALATISDFTANVDWQNGPDSLWLIDDLNNLIDAIQYGLTNFVARGEGTPSLDVSAGFSLARKYAGDDTNNNLADFMIGTPTPGLVKSLISPARNVPTSSTTSIFLLGLVMLIVTYRKRLITTL